jgi:hypothetical protein
MALIYRRGQWERGKRTLETLSRARIAMIQEGESRDHREARKAKLRYRLQETMQERALTRKRALYRGVACRKRRKRSS